MKALVVYDSAYGNTEQIARAIAGALATYGEAKALRPAEAGPAALESLDLLIVGSPTQGGMATKPVQEFLGRIPAGSLDKVKVAAFDTRILGKGRGIGIRLLIRTIGYAAGRIAGKLEAKGGTPAAAPEGFEVKDREGPLAAGEVERAAAWAKTIAESMK